MAIYLRNGERYNYNETQDHQLRLLYSSLIGRAALKVLTLPFVTHIGGSYMNSSFSKRKISSFIKANDIDMSEYQEKDYHSYNDFFTRKIKPEKRIINEESEVLIAPCDSKVTVYPIHKNLTLKIKESVYHLEDLLQAPSLASSYDGGTCLIFRLTVDDYHRYVFIDEGKQEQEHYIPGLFHTVNPIANDYYPIYKTNSRAYTILHTKNFGQVIQMEVGAMMVGRIVNHHQKTFLRGEEKGYFEFGGSTIVLLFKEGSVTIDEDIVKHSLEHDEVKAQLGERIGIKQL